MQNGTVLCGPPREVGCPTNLQGGSGLRHEARGCVLRHRLRGAWGFHRRTSRGQSLVEFALTLPLLMVLLLGVADFGRVFTAGITIEAATRNGAEAAALERLRVKPTTLGDPVYYARLHKIASDTVCAEARVLPNTTFDPVNKTCAAMPVVAVCVQDGADPDCGGLAPGYVGPLPAECDALSTGWDVTSGGLVASHSVEVRACYRFTTLFNLHRNFPLGFAIDLGDVWLVRSRTFIVDCPVGDPSGC